MDKIYKSYYEALLDNNLLQLKDVRSRYLNNNLIGYYFYFIGSGLVDKIYKRTDLELFYTDINSAKMGKL